MIQLTIAAQQSKMAFASTVSTINVILGGMWAACAATAITKGITAPACIVSGVSSIVSIIVSAVSDAYAGHTKNSKGDPDKRSSTEYPSLGDLLLHRGSHTDPAVPFNVTMFHELEDWVPYNLTHLEYNTQHTLEKRGMDRLRVTVAMPGVKEEYTHNLAFLRKRHQPTYNFIAMDAKYLGHDHGVFPSKSEVHTLAQQIADKTTGVGTYCATIHGPKEAHWINMGITTGAKGHDPLGIHGPCAA